MTNTIPPTYHFTPRSLPLAAVLRRALLLPCVGT